MSTATPSPGTTPAPVNSRSRVMVASLAGTAIEYYDFFLYGTAAALVFGSLFFPGESSAAQQLAALGSFAIAFMARPFGSVIFGHYGDRLGRKTMLVASLMIMGLSTALIGLLPGFASIGIAAPLLLCLLRFAQGVGLGGEWGGAALVATENAPPGERAWFGMFPQLGAVLGFMMANGVFLLVVTWLGEAEFREFGWRIPFLLSAVLLGIGIYVRMNLQESAEFSHTRTHGRTHAFPLRETLTLHGGSVLTGAFAAMVCYALFNVSTVFFLSYATQTLGMARETVLAIQCGAVVFMALGIVIGSHLVDRVGQVPVLLAGCALALPVAATLVPALGSGDTTITLIWLASALFVTGISFGPMGSVLPGLFPPQVRYTGASLAYNIGGILGASLVPVLAQQLAASGGLGWVAAYVGVTAVVSGFAVFRIRIAQASTIETGLAEAQG
jgi:MFS family permease